LLLGRRAVWRVAYNLGSGDLALDQACPLLAVYLEKETSVNSGGVLDIRRNSLYLLAYG
jgi:hypothetical protein